jgi:hypothetical protein
MYRVRDDEERRRHPMRDRHRMTHRIGSGDLQQVPELMGV